MSGALWEWDELVAAARGKAEGVPRVPITGFSIDTRSLKSGEVFVALTDVRDGHDFVGKAFGAGAAAALVGEGYAKGASDGPLIRVADPLAGLAAIGAAARARLEPAAKVVAVTGSVGKTGTKEMLRACLSRLGPTHAPEKSFNNHWGVPLTLARMPAGTRYGVFEIGMNHPGEITPLTRLVRLHVAIITTVEPVHIGFFASVEEIADAKAEILLGLEPGGVAILNRDNAHFDRLAGRARALGARVCSFGLGGDAEVRPQSLQLGPSGSKLVVSLGGGTVEYSLGAPGKHIAANSLAVVAAIHTLGGDLETAAGALAGLGPTAGRGARLTLAAPGGSILLIDESYNANPASMSAALHALSLVSRDQFGRRIAVLGDMLELGSRAADLHAGLKPAIEAAEVDLVFAAGPNMQVLYQSLAPSRRGHWAAQSSGLAKALAEQVAGGDVVMIKGSLGSRMAPLVELLARKFAAAGQP